jgi:hypothetical protein
MKVTNCTAKKITLLNGKEIKPRDTVVVSSKADPDLLEQINGLANMNKVIIS